MIWKIDPTHSQVSFTIRVLGVSTTKGRFNVLRGHLGGVEVELLHHRHRAGVEDDIAVGRFDAEGEPVGVLAQVQGLAGAVDHAHRHRDGFTR